MWDETFAAIDALRRHVTALMQPKPPCWAMEDYTPKHSTFEEAMDAAVKCKPVCCAEVDPAVEIPKCPF